ncbi:MAG: hypothetical protein KAT32_04055 [Candidatus Moranbacteria bacterium]|nr:hypothetical protein [Candidatus Moranbacteria bacterium]
MIINEEPSPAKRLIAEARKVNNSLLQKFSEDKKKVVKGSSYLILLMFIFVNFFLINSPFSREQSVFAKETEEKEIDSQIDFSGILDKNPEDIIQDIIDEAEEKIREAEEREEQLIKEAEEKEKQRVLTEKLAVMLEGHPMVEMADEIAKQDQKVAALIVGIGKKESNWGKRSPSKDGQDCFNYWGYKTSGSRGQALGHACFGSREEAVETIAKRISYFVYETKRDTPAKIVIWKCGSSCATTGGQAAANKWISDVQIYYNQVLAFEVVEDENVQIASSI